MSCVVLFVKGGGHRARGVEQIERTALYPSYVARDARLVPRLGAFLTADKVDERAFARILFGEDALMSETMRFVPGLEIKNNRDTLERVFTKRPLYFTDGF